MEPVVITRPAPPEASLLEPIFLRGRKKREKCLSEDVTFKKQLAAWQRGETDRLRHADALIAEFRVQAKRILAHPANATRTDLNGAIERARLFLSEPRFFGHAKPMRVALFKTDGIE